MTGRTAHDPHPLAPDDPGCLGGNENFGLGSRRLDATFCKLMERAGHAPRKPIDDVSAEARKHLAAMVAEHNANRRKR